MKKVAVKIVHDALLGDFRHQRARWRRQAEILRSLDHPNLVKVRDFFSGPQPHPADQTPGGEQTLYLVMPWIKGISLDRWVRMVPLRLPSAVMRCVTPIADAIDYLHSGVHTEGFEVVHRDVKPANVLLGTREPCLVDFGLVRVVGETPMTLAGTPHYVAPECWESATSYSSASDRYALGATAYYALTGELTNPFDPGAMARRLTELAREHSAPGLPDLVMAMLHHEPKERPTSSRAWAEALEACLGPGLQPERTGQSQPGEDTLDLPAPVVRPEPVTVPAPPVPTQDFESPQPASPSLRRRPVRRWAALTLVVALLSLGAIAASVGVRDDQQPGGTTTTTAPPTPEDGRPVLTPGPIGPGEYDTNAFRPKVGLRLGPGWRVEADRADLVELVRESDPTQRVSLVRVDHVYAGRALATPDDALAAVQPPPDDLAEWLQSHDALRTDPPLRFVLGGEGGRRLDATVQSGYTTEVCPRGPCVLLFQLAPYPGRPETSPLVKLQGERIRFLLFDSNTAFVALLSARRTVSTASSAAWTRCSSLSS